MIVLFTLAIIVFSTIFITIIYFLKSARTCNIDHGRKRLLVTSRSKAIVGNQSATLFSYTYDSAEPYNKWQMDIRGCTYLDVIGLVVKSMLGKRRLSHIHQSYIFSTIVLSLFIKIWCLYFTAHLANQIKRTYVNILTYESFLECYSSYYYFLSCILNPTFSNNSNC